MPRGNGSIATETASVDKADAEARNVVVPLDGSRRATRAILPARRLAAALGLPIGVVTVGEDRSPIDRAALESIRAENHLHWTDIIRSVSVAEGIAACAGERDAIIVMATGGRGRSVAIVGSTATTVVSRSTRPVMLVGPGTEVFERRPIEELVVAVSGTRSGESICGPALSMARLYGFEVHFVTVVNRTPESADPQTPSDRRFGPVGDEHAYMADLVGRYETSGQQIVGSVISDPLTPAGGLANMMRRRPQSLLVLGTKNRAGMARLRHGSVASRILSESPVPSIMIPSTS